MPFKERALCGEKGIRTLGTREGTTVFETAPIDHSGISPGRLQKYIFIEAGHHKKSLLLKRLWEKYLSSLKVSQSFANFAVSFS